MNNNIKKIEEKDSSLYYKKELNNLLDVCIQSYINTDYEKLEVELRKYRKIKRKMSDEIDSFENDEEKTIIYKSKFVQTYNIMNKLLNIYIKKQKINNEIISVLQSFSKAREVIFYLYKNHNVRQNMIIKSNIDIKRSTLSDLLNKLISIRCVDRINVGKYPIYNLTIDCRRYVYDNFEQFNEVRIISRQELDSDRNNFIEKKEKAKWGNNIYQKKLYYPEINKMVKEDYCVYGRNKETISNT